MTTSDQTVDSSENELMLTRTFDAPRELVFSAYTTCEHLTHWWGPRTWPMVECSIDFRVGGVWHYCLRGPNPGDESWGRATYTEITAPERIAYRDAFCDADGTVNERMPQVRSTIEFADMDGKTRLSMRAVYASASDLEQVLDMGMVAGMTETLDRLDEHLSATTSKGA